MKQWEILEISLILIFNQTTTVEVSRFDMSNGLTILTNKLVWNFGNTVSIPSGKHLYFIKKIDGLVEETLFYGDILISKQKV